MFGTTLTLATLLTGAHGTPPSLEEIRWDAPEGCPDEATVERTLVRTLGARESGESLGLEAVATARQRSGHWVLELVLTRDGRSRMRRIEADSCRELASAAVLVLAIAIDPELSSSEPPS